ncbi:MAG: hypothetical protein ACREBJ_09860, partial [Nitrosotalea sp.]
MDNDKPRPLPNDLGVSSQEGTFGPIDTDKLPEAVKRELQEAVAFVKDEKYAEAFQKLAPEAKEENVRLFEAVKPLFEEEYNKITTNRSISITEEEEKINDQRILNLAAVVALSQVDPKAARELLEALDIEEKEKKPILDQIPDPERAEAQETKNEELTEAEKQEEQEQKDKAESVVTQAKEQVEEWEEKAKATTDPALQSFFRNRAEQVKARIGQFEH